MFIEEALMYELSSIQGLQRKVYPIVAQQATTVPYLTYRLNTGEIVRNLLSHDSLKMSNYQLDFFHSTYANLVSLRRLVINKIKTWERTNLGGTGPYIQACTIEEEPIETYDDETELYQCTIEIQICYDEN